MAEQILFARNGALFVQVDGPNTKPEYVGCVDVDALAEPGGGIDTLVRCFNPEGTGWNTIGSTLTPPDPVTTSITAQVTATQNFLEQIKNCPATFFIAQSETGRKDTFTNYNRTWILGPAYVNDRGAADLVMRETDAPSTMTFGITAEPPLLRIFKKAMSRQSVSMATSANGVSFLNDVRCASTNNPVQGACKTGYIVGDTPTGSPTGTSDVMYTTTYGQTWTATATDPFAAGEVIAAVQAFLTGANTHRVIVARGTTDAGNPAEIAYSDNAGATWTTVSTGTTVAYYNRTGRSLFALDQYNIWSVVDAGYIFYSEDAGATWTTQDAGVATTSILHAVHFADAKIGYAVGASDAVVKTIDGGVSWGATTTNPASGGTLNTVFVLNAQKVWVGTSNGRLYYTEDGGTTWTRRTFNTDGVGAVKDIKFFNDLIGFMAHDSAAPLGRVLVTHDGGYTWEPVTTTTNAGLNSLAICDENNFYAAGEVSSGTAVLLKIQPTT